jgi:hypothetical protein
MICNTDFLARDYVINHGRVLQHPTQVAYRGAEEAQRGFLISRAEPQPDCCKFALPSRSPVAKAGIMAFWMGTVDTLSS